MHSAERFGFVDRRKEQQRVAKVCKQLAVSASSLEVPVITLSVIPLEVTEA